MIDSIYRNHYQKWIVDPLLRQGWLDRVHPSFLTLLAGCFGIATLPLLAFHHPILAFSTLLMSGFLDTLDGSLARQTNKTSPQGAVFDIVSDRAVEFAVVLGLFLVDPTRALPCLLMLGSILLCVTSFLVVGIFTSNNSEKSFHYSPGLIERAEAFLFFSVMILIPTLFTPLAYLFIALVLWTTIVRVRQFYDLAF